MGTTATLYEQDIVAWAESQASLLRTGQFSRLDIEHLAEEILDVGKSEQRELAHRMTILLAHLLKWAYQPVRRGRSWERTIIEQRKAIERRLNKTPSLRHSLSDPDWWSDAWGDAVLQAANETGLEDWPINAPWRMDQILSHDFFPTMAATS